MVMVTSPAELSGDLIRQVYAAEDAYIREFALAEELPYGVRYTDRLLPDMYCHNFLRLHPESLALAREALRMERSRRREIGQRHVQLELFCEDAAAFADALHAGSLTQHTVMALELSSYRSSGDSCPGVTILPVRTEEEAAMASIVDQRAFGADFSDFAARRYARKALQYRSSGSRLYSILAVSDGEPAGSCDLFIHETTAKIEDVDVLEPFRNRGIGRKMIDFAADTAIEQGASLFTLQVEQGNPAARLYERCGFRKVSSNGIYREFLE